MENAGPQSHQGICIGGKNQKIRIKYYLNPPKTQNWKTEKGENLNNPSFVTQPNQQRTP